MSNTIVGGRDRPDLFFKPLLKIPRDAPPPKNMEVFERLSKPAAHRQTAKFDADQYWQEKYRHTETGELSAKQEEFFTRMATPVRPRKRFNKPEPTEYKSFKEFNAEQTERFRTMAKPTHTRTKFVAPEKPVYKAGIGKTNSSADD
jgi:hypothetical protein